MIRTVGLMVLAAALLVAPGMTHAKADVLRAQRVDEEVQAPRSQDVQAPRDEEVQAPRGRDEEVQAPRNQPARATRG